MKSYIYTIMIGFLLAGCSATWDSMKEDSSKNWKATKDGTAKAYNSTKNAIHKATE